VLDSATAGSLTATSLLDPQVATSSQISPSGDWADLTQFDGYADFIVSLGQLTGSAAVSVQLESSASNTGSSPASGGNAALFPVATAANSPEQLVLTLPLSFFANRYVGAVATVTGSGNVPIGIIMIASKRHQ
jgi:hypothetical protein